MKLVLASASPRRRELLGLLGLEFEVVPAGVAEISDGDPSVIVVENALRKARAVADPRPGAVVLGVDTDVVCDGRLLGKPNDDGDATARLRALAGRTHEVLSGVALIAGGREESDLVRTAVTFRDLDDREIETYVASGEWRDRAGGYAVQGLGSALVERIEGDLSNVIGLPIPALSRMIAELQER
ncbi:MAG TPA: Maf family protein [Solirubrobacterales bacterium]|nr:Maf family protein [Solirubrobacterales bacterium]